MCPYFFGSDKVCQSSIQSDNSIDSYRVYDLQRYKQTDIQTLLQKPFFLTQVSKCRFDENSESALSHKTNTFSYDENVKKIIIITSLKLYFFRA